MIKREVTMGQLIGWGFTAISVSIASWINMNVRMSLVEQNADNTQKYYNEIKISLKENQAASNVILQELGALKAQVNDLQRHNDLYDQPREK